MRHCNYFSGVFGLLTPYHFAVLCASGLPSSRLQPFRTSVAHKVPFDSSSSKLCSPAPTSRLFRTSKCSTRSALWQLPAGQCFCGARGLLYTTHTPTRVPPTARGAYARVFASSLPTRTPTQHKCSTLCAPVGSWSLKWEA